MKNLKQNTSNCVSIAVKDVKITLLCTPSIGAQVGGGARVHEYLGEGLVSHMTSGLATAKRLAQWSLRGLGSKD